jgi:glucose-6-phosphate isomerase
MSNPWQQFENSVCLIPSVDLMLDISHMAFKSDFFERMKPKIESAFKAMAELERGAIANPDEKRMVGHYWLRAPQLAPTAEISREIEETVSRIKSFAADVHTGRVRPPNSDRFTQLISIGIGGSALGPMFVHDALGNAALDSMSVSFIDNTDPDGIERVLRNIGPRLNQTLCLVISKSGSTPEPRNGLICASAALRDAGLDFARQAVAVTGEGSQLDQQAAAEGWLARFPMWDWVGGRTSEFSAVGLVPAALQGLDVDSLLAGAAACDEVTRIPEVERNPSALLALMWYHATDGRGLKDMVVLPYKDRLLLFSRYLQQLVMESLGKRLNVKGERVDQGIAVYGNKGSTDQHAYVQQLRDGVNNFFVTFIRVLESGGTGLQVEPGVTPGDYLHGFLLGTRAALFENGRQSITITIPRVDARSLGALIALFERAVGFYASIIGINAYHQPGVEAGKKAAAAVLALQSRVVSALSSEARTAQQIASAISGDTTPATVFYLLEHLASNGRARVVSPGLPGAKTFASV